MLSLSQNGAIKYQKRLKCAESTMIESHHGPDSLAQEKGKKKYNKD